ncbi:hypothetical protein PUNSTDRAFT_125114 [Punctularia strigosozonata HHB-11173 SS5]|uniref:uncharacterized protein n=1 Tax=Punctularia strigosozonata (strain HHB-11173) TaxID=741275 RepID=UPI0004417AA6|nr:uncharacterized protein PUNSTDRAFT_125114 [Punctularia strigosozonata HHB-11173 SS5]EIN12069.1 hypothetical protein PUNSTDRAFT_125114 [Punctularia strigosozonata HHB-11173 SS5]
MSDGSIVSFPTAAGAAEPSSSTLVSGNSTSPGGGDSLGPPPPNTDLQLIFWLEVFYLGCLAAFTLALAPWAIARFRHKAEWGAGWLLRRVTLPAHVPETPQPNIASSPVDSEVSDEKFDASSVVRPPNRAHPRLASYSTRFPILSALLRTPITERYSVGSLIISAVYIGSVLFATFYNINPFVKGKRFGYVAISQFPIVYTLSTKNNPIGWLVGVGYEKLNHLHRVAGITVAIAANFHGFTYIIKYSMNNTLSKLNEPEKIYGLTAMVTLDVLIIIMSLPVIRRRWYRAFYVSHIVGLVVLVVLIYYHEATTAKYAFATAMIYAADRALRLIRTRIVTATISPIPELGMTRVTVPLNAGWRPGQHVRVRVLTSGMGMFRWSEAHPFTIATAPRTEENLVLMCKATGGWTTDLYNYARGDGRSDKEEATTSKIVRMWVEGPYGGTGHTLLNSFSAAVLIAGGSGITFIMAAAQDIMRSAANGQTHLKTVRVVWSVREPGSLKALMPTLASLQEAWPSSVALEISVHYTRASAYQENSKLCLPYGMSLEAGRPRTTAILESVMARLGSDKKCVDTSLSGVVVGVCGPGSLGEEVKDSIGALGIAAMRSVGGVEIHQEVFGW